ncbi:MAG TPA: VWA domain-containing protein [Vicinamibacterales bacterium]
MRLVGLVLSAVLCLAAAPQAPPPQFKTGIEVRRLDVVVLDQNGRPVHGLTAADFTVLEDGRPQKISTLDEIIVPQAAPPPAAWMRDVAPDVGTNDIPTDGRLIVIVLDDAMTSDPRETDTAREIAGEIVDNLGPADLASIVFTLENHKSQDFTADRSRLQAAIDRMRPGPLPGSAASQLASRYSMQTIKKAAEYLRAIEGRRKSIIYVSVGVPIDWNDISSPIANLGAEGVTVNAKENMRSLGSDLHDTLGESQLSNVAVYAVSPRGLTVGMEPLENEFLRALSANTGGFAIVNTNTPEAQVPSIFTATSAYYLIGYEVQKPDDGRFRRLEIKVDRPGAVVHARRGYVAPRPDRRAAADEPEREISPLATAMAGFLPKGDVPMRAVALPFAIAGKQEARVAIVARVQQPAVPKRTTQQVELLTAAFDPDGKAGSRHRQTARVTMLPSGTSQAEYEVLSMIDLKPGRYNLRISAHNPALERSGSVFHDVDVPDFRKNGLWLSAAALMVTPGLMAAPRNALDGFLPSPPTTLREFAGDDEVTGFLQIVQGGKSQPRKVDLQIRIVDGNDTVVHQAADTIESALFSTGRIVEYPFSVPIAHLVEGSYLLSIEATDGERSARRDVRFTRK